MISWEELQNNKVEVHGLASSAHMLECIQIVRKSYPNAAIADHDAHLWQLKDGEQVLSELQTSHYACWLQARKTIESSNTQ